MSLTSGFTLLLLSAATFGTTLFVVIFWKKMYRQTLANFIFRFIVIVLCQVLALVSIGLEINRTNGFYESWNDLLGTNSNYVQNTSHTNQVARISKSTISKAEKLPYGSRLIRDVATGAESKVSNVVYIDLPPAAIADISKKVDLNAKRYKVVEFFTGFPSQPIMWIKVLKVEKVLGAYNAKHPDRQIIGVFPQVNIAGSYDLECMNLPGNRPAAETWLSTDMHKYINERLGIQKSRWGVMGVSTGGWCASMLSVRHPDLYSAAASIAGYYRPALPLSDPISLQKAMAQKYDFEKSESQLQGKLPLYVVASLGDRYSIRETKRFLTKPHSHLAITYKELANGGHNSRVWVNLVPHAIYWLERNISV